MEKSVAGTIGEFGEPKPLFRVEPLNDCSDGRTGGCLEPGFAEARSAAKRTGLWVVGISAELATPRMAEILVSQTWFPSGVAGRLGRAMCDARSAKLMRIGSG